MQRRMLAALIGACAMAGGALADTTVINNQVQLRESNIALPKRGSTMEEVEKNFGAPVTRHPTVGGASAAQPPITRWDYKDFSVVFERQWVIDSVVLADASSPAPSTAPSGAPAPAAAGSVAPATGAAQTPAGSASPAPDAAAPPESAAPAEAPSGSAAPAEAPPPPATAPAPQG